MSNVWEEIKFLSDLQVLGINMRSTGSVLKTKQSGPILIFKSTPPYILDKKDKCINRLHIL